MVPTAHVAQVPERFLDHAGVRHLWSNDVTGVQGFGLGPRVVGVQFHPELSAREARWAAGAFRQQFGAPSSWAPAAEVDPGRALGAALDAAGSDRLGMPVTPEPAGAPRAETLAAV